MYLDRAISIFFQSAVRYDKFESLSLPLPSGAGDLGWGRHKLHQLLTNFVTPEVVQDVQCEGCNRDRDPAMSPILSRQIKILNFGKVFVFLIVKFCTIIHWFASSCQYVFVYIFQGIRGRLAVWQNGRITSNFPCGSQCLPILLFKLITKEKSQV